MTYPQQPGQPPYGQQPGGPYGAPPSGGFPQQGGQYPQSGQYAQYPQGGPYAGAPGYPQQYPYNAQQGGYGQPPQPPKKNRTGLWIGLGAGAVAVVAFLVTGLLAPGFLLGDDEDSDGSASGGDDTTGQQTGGQGNDPSALAQQISAALTSGDTATLQGLTCAGATEMVVGAVQQAGTLGQVAMTGQPQVSGQQATTEGTATVDGSEYAVTATFAQENGNWCWQDVQLGAQTPGAGGTSDLPGVPNESGAPTGTGDEGTTGDGGGDAQTFLDEFGAALEAGDEGALTGMLCEGASEDAKQSVEQALAADDSYTAEDVTASDSLAEATFIGSKGELIVLADNFDGHFCAYGAIYY
ncbi:hypothetical protein B1813_13310 [Saccharomonospora piscinae]|uniref:DUF4878 domain-containing protein n=1 Tax=Saccharomonospora piscinae TaxID=687388 RepID=A0A1V9A0R7_SACPI|nr:DUF3824 domain-containing protein [Saccharomonospora piscinae]OQO90534.1 hypothetical protein B1813_13310 [Saccharomonospora piscinae]